MWADNSPVFVHPVVVGGNRTSTNIGALPDVGIADVGEVGNLGAARQGRVLDFHERSNLAVFANISTWAQKGERANVRAGANIGTLGMGSNHCGTLANDGVGERRVRSDNRTGGNAGVPAELDAGENLDITGQLNTQINEAACGVMNRDACKLVTPDNHLIQECLDFTELNTIVDSLE
jgi:hypothetical protein